MILNPIFNCIFSNSSSSSSTHASSTFAFFNLSINCWTPFSLKTLWFFVSPLLRLVEMFFVYLVYKRCGGSSLVSILAEMLSPRHYNLHKKWVLSAKTDTNNEQSHLSYTGQMRNVSTNNNKGETKNQRDFQKKKDSTLCREVEEDESGGSASWGSKRHREVSTSWGRRRRLEEDPVENGIQNHAFV